MTAAAVNPAAHANPPPRSDRHAISPTLFREDPFLKELGFKMDLPSISGRYYRVSFTGPANVVSISYEPGDDALLVVVFSMRDGQLSDIDNRIDTPRLADLNSRYMKTVSKNEISKNDAKFEPIAVQDKEERFLLKAAKELCLVFPKYLARSKDGMTSNQGSKGPG